MQAAQTAAAKALHRLIEAALADPGDNSLLRGLQAALSPQQLVQFRAWRRYGAPGRLSLAFEVPQLGIPKPLQGPQLPPQAAARSSLYDALPEHAHWKEKLGLHGEAEEPHPPGKAPSGLVGGASNSESPSSSNLSSANTPHSPLQHSHQHLFKGLDPGSIAMRPRLQPGYRFSLDSQVAARRFYQPERHSPAYEQHPSPGGMYQVTLLRAAWERSPSRWRFPDACGNLEGQGSADWNNGGSKSGSALIGNPAGADSGGSGTCSSQKTSCCVSIGSEAAVLQGTCEF